MNESGGTTRRGFLRKTVGFSAIAALQAAVVPAMASGLGLAWPSAAGLPGDDLQAAYAPPDPAAAHMLMIGDWGTDRYIDQQISVSRSMQQWMEQRGVKPQASFLLGDNWYGALHDGLNSPRWQTQFEQMYPVSHFPGPAYAVLGNHDYERHGHESKVDLQLQYGRTRQTRWTMPDKWYTFQWPQPNPLITFICLDSNLPGTKPFEFLPGSFLMSHEERDAQDAWFAAELQKPKTTPFRVVIAHHPLYTNGIHRDNPILITRWDKLLRDARVDLYMTGHDHDLQHLEFAGHPTSFVISGGGGAELVDWTVPPDRRGPFGAKVLGFSDLEVTPQSLTVRHITQGAQELHAFRRTPDGRMTVMKSS